jgi:hypothetical protein
MSVGTIQIGEHKATLESSSFVWSCPTDAVLELKLNQWQEQQRVGSYTPDPLYFCATEAVKHFGGKVLHVDRMKYKFNPNVVY